MKTEQLAKNDEELIKATRYGDLEEIKRLLPVSNALAQSNYG